jgi:hypothetical protein
MTLPGDEKTKQKALDLLLELAEGCRSAIDDRQLREVAAPNLVTAVFELAWKHQWDRTPDNFLRAVRPIVDQAVAEAVISIED